MRGIPMDISFKFVVCSIPDGVQVTLTQDDEIHSRETEPKGDVHEVLSSLGRQLKETFPQAVIDTSPNSVQGQITLTDTDQERFFEIFATVFPDL